MIRSPTGVVVRCHYRVSTTCSHDDGKTWIRQASARSQASRFRTRFSAAGVRLFSS